MKLEDEIKQKKFKNEYHKIIVNVMYTNNWLNTINNQFLKPHGLSAQQYNILRILRGQYPKPVMVNLLIDRMLDKMSNASRLVEKLRQKGYVDRKVAEGDRRAVDVLITSKGLELLSYLDKEADLVAEKLKSISVTEAEELNRILDKVRG